FGTACCPSNIARLLASVGDYIYAKEGNKMWVNLYIGSRTKIKLTNTDVSVAQNDTFLQDGSVKITINPLKKSAFEVLLRLPAWAGQASTAGDLYYTENFSAPKIKVLINNKAVHYTLVNGYITIKRTWNKGDVIDFSLPMDVLRIKAHDRVEADANKIALQRGPFVYCLEGIDNPSSNWSISSSSTFTTQFDPNQFNGIASINIKNPATSNLTLKAIPYFTWANRGKSKMEVWIKRAD
ncbi:MAG: glycoside hydrolase family 127 protein, partial [Chitinophagaceae bacterium]